MQKKPVVTEVRTPTDTWSGLGFSKSMPAEAVKELRSISRRCYKPYLSTIGTQQNQVLNHQATPPNRIIKETGSTIPSPPCTPPPSPVMGRSDSKGLQRERLGELETPPRICARLFLLLLFLQLLPVLPPVRLLLVHLLLPCFLLVDEQKPR